MEQYLKLFTKVEDGLPAVNKMVVVITKSGRMVISWIDSGSKEFDIQDISEDDPVTHYLEFEKLTTIEAATEAIRNAYEQGGQDWDYGMDTENYVSKAIKKL